MIGFLAPAIVAYCLPLYLPAAGYPKSAIETWGMYGIIAWLVGPPAAGALVGRLGEKGAWAIGLGIYAAGAVLLALLPLLSTVADVALGACAFLFGAGASISWLGSISLFQNVPRKALGYSNSLMMVSLGVGNVGGPLAGRFLLHGFAFDPSSGARFLPPIGAFFALSVFACVLVLFRGQHPGHAAGTGRRAPAGRIGEALHLLRTPGFIMLLLPLSVLAGPVFQASNVYLPYRAADPGIALIVGSEDRGWSTLQVAAQAAAICGGILLGAVSGRRVSGRFVSFLLGGFAAAGLCIGLASSPLALMAACGAFEAMRQFMRWAMTGYLSERVPDSHRTAALSMAMTLSSMGSIGYTALMRLVQSPDSPSFSSPLPFFAAAACGLTGAVMLFSARRPYDPGR